MTEEFLQQQKTDNNLCFRDLLQWAQHWQEKYGDKANIQIPVDPIPQVGSICKTTAIATVEGYYAKKLGYEPIPLHKRGKAAHSVRQIAKLQESKQGEILEFNRWQNVAREMGYQTIIEPFNDFPHFLACILDHLQQDNLPLIGFSVKENVGQPDPDPFNPEDREHAAVITGYNFQTDEFTLTHWGASYNVDAVSLYNSNQALVQTRKQEQYVKNPQYLKENKFFTPKYLPSQTAGIASIVPEANTGFNGKLLVVKKPEDLDQLLIARSESLYKTTGFFTAKPEPCNSMALMTECSPP